MVAKAEVSWTFPLQFAEIVWGNILKTQHQTFVLHETREFGSAKFEWSVDATDRKWVRLDIWDIAGNGALVNPIWR